MNFKEEIFELAFGDDAINKDYTEEEVLAKIREFSDKALENEEHKPIIYVVKYKEHDSIEGYVESEEQFTEWLRNHNIKRIREGEISEYKDEFDLIETHKLDNVKSYIYALFDGEEQIDQTSLDEMNENLAWEIMVEDEGRNPKGLSVSLIDEVQEDDS